MTKWKGGFASGVFRVGVGLQGSECSEWVQSAQGARRWRSCLGGVAVADWQNSPDQVSDQVAKPLMLTGCSVCKLEAGSENLIAGWLHYLQYDQQKVPLYQ